MRTRKDSDGVTEQRRWLNSYVETWRNWSYKGKQKDVVRSATIQGNTISMVKAMRNGGKKIHPPLFFNIFPYFPSFNFFPVFIFLIPLFFSFSSLFSVIFRFFFFSFLSLDFPPFYLLLFYDCLPFFFAFPPHFFPAQVNALPSFTCSIIGRCGLWVLTCL